MENRQLASHLYEDSLQIHNNHVLATLLRKNPNLDEAKIREAYLFCIEAHSNQFRKSGMPYVEHPIEVAKLLAEYQVDTPTLIAGLLHDVVEDTDYTVAQIEARFGTEVAFMVDAVSKISEIQETGNSTKEAKQAATYRKLLEGVVKDPRVLMIKIADRLHNMRTLHFVPNDQKQKRIALETIEVYSPLAHRFGLGKIKAELEDLSFKFMHPEQYKEILEQLAMKREDREHYINTVVHTLRDTLGGAGFKAKIQGRPKNLYSIYHKIVHRHSSVDNIYDLFAVRIIVQSPIDCYTVLGHIHTLWSPIQSRFKDYIASPKPNLYQSIHTTVLGPGDRMVEIQIRTEEMDKVSERGFAAHWQYKSEKMGQVSWLQEILHHHHDLEAKEFLEFLKNDLEPTDLICFTPDGDAVELPKGATILDFAYAVHTNLGHQCIGARIDEQFVPMDKVLNYGANVKILRSNLQKPNREWMFIAKTTRARASIRKFLRLEERNRHIQLGKTILEREYRLLDIAEKPGLEFYNRSFFIQSFEELYEKLGTGEIQLEKFKQELSVGRDFQIQRQESLVLNQQTLALTQFLPCCAPVPGDEIIALISQSQGICLHRFDCSLGQKQLLEHPNDQIPVVWDEQDQGIYDVRIEVLGQDRELMLLDMTEIFKSLHISVVRASIDTEEDHIKNFFELKVHGLSQLNVAVQRLETLPGVERVLRL